MNIIHVVGARPNFMKVDPVIRALAEQSDYKQKLVHTGQHYDEKLSDIFFRQLGLKEPDVNLKVGSGNHSVQTANIILRFSEYLDSNKTDLVIVYGDVNSTLGAAIVCSKRGIPIAHVEAGLRSFDTSMPEEINRILTDRISNLLFTTSIDANENLVREGIPSSRINFTGNVMIDTLVRLKPEAKLLWGELSDKYKIEEGKFVLVTLHRPSNVDDKNVIFPLFEELINFSHQIPLIYPVHPRTKKMLEKFCINTNEPNFYLVEPMDYLQFISLLLKTKLVITDSGGVQEESSYLGIPCLTVRENTERPVTITEGTNHLVGTKPEKIRIAFNKIMSNDKQNSVKCPLLWDGRAAQRIADIAISFLK